MPLDMECPRCGESWQVLSAGEMDKAAGYPLDHRLNGTVPFYTQEEVRELVTRACEMQREACWKESEELSDVIQCPLVVEEVLRGTR